MKKVSAIILITIIAVSTIGLAASAYAMPFMNWKNLGKMLGPRNQAIQQSFVRVDGVITQWGSDAYKGGIEAQARTVVLDLTNVKQGASASAIWSNETRPTNAVDKANFNYTFYAAKLVSVTNTSLNDGYSFVLNGTWNVYKVFSNFTVTKDSQGNIIGFHRNQDVTFLATKAVGNLTVSQDQKNFTLAITGINDLTGSVHAQRISTKNFNPFRINNDDATTTVTKADIAAVVKSYGSSPGWGNYDQRMDYNLNFKVDITDLSTAAANVDT